MRDPSATGTGPARRVLMVAHSRQLGGIERHVVGLSTALAEAGHAVAFAGPRDGWLGEAMAAAGHDCTHVPMRGMYDLISARRIAGIARDWRADVLHGHAQRGGRYARWARRGAGVPAVVTAHSTNAWRWFGPDHPILAVSDAVRRALIDKGLPGANISVVYPGVADLGPVPPAPPGPLSADRPLVLGMVARVEEVKGHDIALRALAELADLPLRLDIVGPDGTDWAARLRALLDELQLGARVRFLGQRSDLAAVWAGIDVALAPSRREALSLSLIEAASAARPAIGADLGGIPEAILGGTTGLLVPPEDPQALAAAIRRMADATLRDRMGAAARAHYQALFTPAAMLRGVTRAYDAVLAGKEPRG